MKKIRYAVEVLVGGEKKYADYTCDEIHNNLIDGICLRYSHEANMLRDEYINHWKFENVRVVKFEVTYEEVK